MEPTINIGDIVLVKNVNIQDLSEGDIISYRKGESVITHRIDRITVQGNEKIITTKGDNNNTEDDYEITEGNIEGKVEKIIPKVGNISLLLQNKVVIIVVILVMYIMYSRSTKRQQRKNIRRLKRLEYEEKQSIEKK